jgi:hypothetical protein
MEFYLNELGLYQSKSPNSSSKISEICQYLLNIYYAFESDLPEIIVSNHFKHPDK